MTRPLSGFKLQRMRPPVRRLLALDAGSRRLKLLLAESEFGRLRVLRQELIDLQAEGLVAAEEIKDHLQATFEEWGRPPLALVLPQHLSISQVIDLPLVPESEVEKLIADESIKLSGVSQSRIVYDFVRTESPNRNRQQFWVTLSQEGDIRERIARLGLEHEDLCEVTTTSNALIAAFRASSPLSSRAILVHLGAQTTVVVVLLAGQGAFATSFQMGGDFLTRALARILPTAEESAEALKRQKDLLTGPEVSAEFTNVVDGWVAELKRQLNEWFQQNAALAAEVESFELIASGGGFEQPGLLEYLKGRASLDLKPWPKGTQPDAILPAKGFEVAFGTALQALGYSPQPVSLLPEEYRLAWQKRLGRRRIELASAVLLAICVLILSLGTWHKLSLISSKNTLLAKVQASQDAADENDSLTADLLVEYENLRPVFAAQQNTADTLKSLALLQQTRSNRNFWCVLLADQRTYFSRPATVVSTNRTDLTNVLGPVLEPPGRPSFLRPRFGQTMMTNMSSARPGLIAELSVPADAEAARQVLSQLVNGLKQQALFSKVDLLSDDLRRNLADPKVIVKDRDYVLSLDFSQTDFQRPVRVKRPLAGSGRAPRRSSRFSRPVIDPGEAGSEMP